jgi:hypothetical protein
MQLVIRYPALASSMHFGLALRPLKAACIFAGSNAENTIKRRESGRVFLPQLSRGSEQSLQSLRWETHTAYLWLNPASCCALESQPLRPMTARRSSSPKSAAVASNQSFCVVPRVRKRLPTTQFQSPTGCSSISPSSSASSTTPGEQRLRNWSNDSPLLPNFHSRTVPRYFWLLFLTGALYASVVETRITVSGD